MISVGPAPLDDGLKLAGPDSLQILLEIRGAGATTDPISSRRRVTRNASGALG
jgi:hypothetical protein